MQLELPETNTSVPQIPLRFHEGHDDDHEGDEGMLDEDHPMWRSERIALTSVGIDIGSSTSHLIFSRLTLRRQGVVLSSRFVVVKREILSESPILLTPYVDKTTIDTQKLDVFIQEAYRRAGLTPADIDTGTLTLTPSTIRFEGASVQSEWPVDAVEDYVIQKKDLFEFRNGKTYHRFLFSGRSPMKWVFYIRYLKGYELCEQQGHL